MRRTVIKTETAKLNKLARGSVQTRRLDRRTRCLHYECTRQHHRVQRGNSNKKKWLIIAALALVRRRRGYGAQSRRRIIHCRCRRYHWQPDHQYRPLRSSADISVDHALI